MPFLLRGISARRGGGVQNLLHETAYRLIYLQAASAVLGGLAPAG